MATLMIPGVDDHVYAWLKQRAAENHRSIESEVRAQLGQDEDIAREPFDLDGWIEKVREIAIEMKGTHGEQPDSVALIRQVRDEE